MNPNLSPSLIRWGATPPVWLSRNIIRQIEMICRESAAHHQVEPDSLFMRGRGPRMVSDARQLAMATLRACGLPLQTVGWTFTGRDHGTVIHACNAIAARRQTDQALNHFAEELLNQSMTKP